MGRERGLGPVVKVAIMESKSLCYGGFDDGAKVQVCVLCARTHAHLAGLGGGGEERKRSSGRVCACVWVCEEVRSLK